MFNYIIISDFKLQVAIEHFDTNNLTENILM